MNALLLFIAASTTFPDVVQEHLGLPDAPECTLCHDSLSGGLGTAIQPFGESMLAHGATAGDVASIRAALDAAAADGTDSDGDGVGDIAELRAGTSPNSVDDVPELRYGFGCSSTSTSSLAWIALLLLVSGGVRGTRAVAACRGRARA